MDEMRHKEEGTAMDKLEAEIDAVPTFTEGGAVDVGMALASARHQVKLLKAHLVTKGYGHNAIKRILNGVVVG